MPPIEDHGEVISGGNRPRVRCNYCRKVLSRVSNLKRHLAGKNGKTSACPCAPHGVWKMFQNKPQPPPLKGFTRERRRTNSSFCQSKPPRSTRDYEDSPTTTIIVADSNDAAESHLSESEPETVNNVHGGQQKPYKEGYFEEVEVVGCSIRKIKESWPSSGCSILVDGWRDPIEGRDLVCFVVDCPNGPIYFQSSYHVTSSRNNGDLDDALNVLIKVVESVGEDNVVQVVATSTFGWIGALRDLFVEKYTKVFWTTSASHNILLMLEKIGRLDRVKAVLHHLKSSSSNNTNKSVRSTLETLQNVLEEKHQLETQVKDASDFWTEAKIVLKATLPLCGVLELISLDKLQMGYIYDALDRAKEEIKKELKESDNYMPFWKVIDDVWTKYLHSPLHAAGYYLNPGFFYSDEFVGCDKQVTNGLVRCMVCMIRDHQSLDRVSLHLEKYRVASGPFEEGSSGSHRDIPPVEWWRKYGGECPELQKFAIRVLSQTCDGASRYGLRRHIAERMSTKGRKSAKQSSELLHEDFVHYNLLLQNMNMNMNMNMNHEVVISDNADGHSSSREEPSRTVRGGWMEPC